MPTATSTKVPFKRPLARPHGLRLALGFLIALCVALVAQPTQAQFALPEGLGAEGPAAPPGEVDRYGNIEAIDVESPLSGFTLFTIASPTVYDRSPEGLGEQTPVEQRAAEIQAKLVLLLERPMDPDTTVFEVSTLRNSTVIDVRDEQHPRPLVLATITAVDADYNGQPIDDLAQTWRTALEDDLRSGLENLPEDNEQAFQIVLGLILLTAAVFGLKYGFYRRQKMLRRRKQAINESASEEGATPQTEMPQRSGNEQVTQRQANFLQRLQQVFSLDRRLALLDFIQWGLFWIVVLAWYGGGIWVGSFSPYLLARSEIAGPLRAVIGVMTVWFFTGLVIRLSRRLINRFTVEQEGLDLTDFLTYGDAHRRHLRASTIAGAAKGLVTVAIAVVGFLQALRFLNVSTVSLVAITSVAGLAITFGSQSLVKDLVNGFFILAEDQYAVGDVIDLGSVAGLVENLNLRVTQLRGVNGDLVTIPNSSIAQVKNLTRSWSRVVFSIDVAYRTDPDKALDVMKTVAQGLYDDPNWHEKIVAEPAVLGIDSVTHSGMTLTTFIETEPAQQWAVGREFRLRVRRALAEQDIDIGAPRQSYVLESPSPREDKPTDAVLEQNR
ncbi:MAG: mechanosensitive ion channel family protein [Cyanobacteria bacterium P01_A01_bin.135]